MKNYESDIPDWDTTPLKKNRKLKTLIQVRQEAAAKIAEAEVTKKTCSDEILTIMTSAGVEKARVDDYAVSVVTTERESVDTDMVKRCLLEDHEMPVSVIEKLWKKCTRKTSSSYVKVTERKAS